MLKNIKPIYFILASVLIIAVLGFYFIVYREGLDTSNRARQIEEENRRFGLEPGDIGYQEPQTTVRVGTREVTGGTFLRAEEGSVFVETTTGTVTLPLTVDEVVVACTNQDLGGVSVLDFEQVAKVEIATPATVGDFVKEGLAVVVFASDVEGLFRAHTIAISASECAS